MAGLSWTWTMNNSKVLESRLGFTRFAQIIGINNKIDPRKLGVDTGPLSPIVVALTTLGEAVQIALSFRTAALDRERVDGIIADITNCIRSL